MSADSMAEANAALEVWARWANSALSGIGWPRESLLARIIKLGVRGAAQSGGVTLTEVDELAELVDMAIKRLDETEMRVIVETYYGRAKASEEAATRCGLTYGWYRIVLARAKRSIADYLEGVRHGAAVA